MPPNRAKPADDGPLPEKLGFPPRSLCAAPLRMEVLCARKGVYAAVSKPAGVLVDSYPGAPHAKSAVLAMRENPRKGELLRLGLVSPYSVNQIDFEMSGAALLAADRDSASSLRNALWSGFFNFKYLLLCRGAPQKEKFEINLPIRVEGGAWAVSHRFGKRASTSFELLGQSGNYGLWKAEASAVRPHQIRLHASEGGLAVVGETLYSKTPSVFLSEFKAGYKPGAPLYAEKPLYPRLCAHLFKIKFDGGKFGMPAIGAMEIECPLPKAFAVCLKRAGFDLDALKKY